MDANAHFVRERSAPIERQGATDEAVARALEVVTATTRALASVPPTDDAERARIRGYVDRSTFELGRLRKLDAAARERTEERSRAHRQREQRSVSRSGPSRSGLPRPPSSA